MTDDTVMVENSGDPLADLRTRTESLETRFTELRQQSDARLIRAEMKAEAIRAGMIDLDCLQFLDLSSVKVDEKGGIDEAARLVAQLKRSKPWLFAASSSSSFTTAPSAQPPRQKHASEMTEAEYAIARAALLRHHF